MSFKREEDPNCIQSPGPATGQLWSVWTAQVQSEPGEVTVAVQHTRETHTDKSLDNIDTLIDLYKELSEELKEKVVLM